jgi:hypothetical protein
MVNVRLRDGLAFNMSCYLLKTLSKLRADEQYHLKNMLSTDSVLTPLGLAACVVLLALSILRRVRKNERHAPPQVFDLKQKGPVIRYLSYKTVTNSLQSLIHRSKLHYPRQLKITSWSLRTPNSIGRFVMAPTSSPWAYGRWTGTSGLRWIRTSFLITTPRFVN